MTLRAALYARVSSQKQALKDLSVPMQIDNLTKYALDNGMHIVASPFIDEGISGRSADKRPKFQEMINFALRKDKPVDVILVWNYSRFARNRYDSIFYKAKLKKHGVQLISLNERIEDNPSGKLMEAIFEAFDEHQSLKIGYDTVNGMIKNAQLGYFNGGNPPYGYEIEVIEDDRKNKRRKLKINENEAPVVKRIFELCTSGMGAKEIVKKFAIERIKNRNDQHWNKKHVYCILKNENYTGTYVWHKKGETEPLRFQGHHPAIVDSEVFQKAQGLLADRSPKQIHPRQVASNYLLSGLLYCSLCGARMKIISGKSGQHRYYTCSNLVNKGEHVCTNKGFNINKMESFIVEILKQKVLTERHLKELVKIISEEFLVFKKNSTRDLEHLDKQLKTIDKRSKKLYEAIETGKLSLEIIAPRLNDLHKDKNALLAEYSGIKQQLEQEVTLPTLTEDKVKPVVRELKLFFKNSALVEQRSFIRSFIKKINVNLSEAEIEYTVPLIPLNSLAKHGSQQKAEIREVLSIGNYGSQEWDRTTDQSVTI